MEFTRVTFKSSKLKSSQFLIFQKIMNPVPNLHDTKGQQTKTQTRALYENKNSKLTSWSNMETT